MANSVDPDQMPHHAASDLGLHCLLRPVYPNIYGLYIQFGLNLAALLDFHVSFCMCILQPTKKNVRFADLCYEEQAEQGEAETEENKLFVRRNKGMLSNVFFITTYFQTRCIYQPKSIDII